MKYNVLNYKEEIVASNLSHDEARSYLKNNPAYYIEEVGNNDMEIINKSVSVVTQVVYTIQDNISAFYYKELIDKEGNVIESIIMSKDGDLIDDRILIEKIFELVNNHSLKS